MWHIWELCTIFCKCKTVLKLKAYFKKKSIDEENRDAIDLLASQDPVCPRQLKRKKRGDYQPETLGSQVHVQRGGHR